MDFGRLFKGIVIIAVLIFGWKVGLPWIQKQGSSTSASVADSDCVGAAARASERWGSGLGRFINPPYDTTAWSAFKDDVDGAISSAESECSCAEESCAKANEAMRDLRSLVADFDSAIQSGSGPPGDAVRQQETIDTRIEQADELARAGK